MNIKLIAILLSIICTPAIAQKGKRNAGVDHYQAMTAYSSAFPLVNFAEKTCPGVRANMMMLLNLRLMANISEDEEPLIRSEMQKVAAGINDSIEKSGKLGWCSNVWSLFGDKGSLMPGLLSRP